MTYRKVVKVVQRVPIYPKPCFLCYSHLTLIVYMCHTNQSILVYIYSSSTILYSNFFSFSLMFIFCPRVPPPGHHVTFNHHLSFAFSAPQQFLRLYLFWLTLTLRSTGHAFCRMPLNLRLSAVFLMVRQGL